MSLNPFNHVDLRVRDLAEAWSFYSRLLPALGFDERWEGPEWRGFSAPGTPPDRAGFGITEDPDHRPNANRIAFWVESRERVDAIAELVRQSGARTVSGPKACPEYTPSDYAVFFEDPSGNRLEVVHRVP